MIVSAGYREDHCRPIFAGLRVLTVYNQHNLLNLFNVRENLSRLAREELTDIAITPEGDIKLMVPSAPKLEEDLFLRLGHEENVQCAARYKPGRKELC